MTGPSRDIGRFSDAELIGRGGFGSVYRAADSEHGRDVAIKVLQGTLGETERRRFDRERQTMGRLGSHPNIIPVHESGYTDAGEGYIVMELATGGSLRDRLDTEQTIPWKEATEAAIAIAKAAQAAHDQGVLHRDIKPDNILIDLYGNPRLTDFGIAAVANNATATTSTTATLAHAAPELLQGQPSTRAVDIYAVGSTLYNLITGWPPFQRPGDEGVTALITRALTEPPPDLAPFGVPDAVARVATRALAKAPEDRQETAAQLADELTAAIAAAEGAVGAPPSATGPTASDTVAAMPPAHDPRTMAAPGQAPSTQLPPNQQPVHGQPSQPVAYDQTVVSGQYQNPVQQTHNQPQYQQPHYQQPGQQVGAGVGAYVAPKDNTSGRKALWLGLGALLAVVAVGVGALVVTSGSGGSDEPGIAAENSGENTDTSDDTSIDGAETTESSTTDESSGADGSGADGSASTETSISTTTSTTTTTTSSTTTTTSSTTTSTTTTEPPVDPSCPQEVLDAQTPRFNVQICGDGTGALTYIGGNRSTGDGIELPACYLGLGAFQARNAGFIYEVDTEFLALTVTDPDGDLIVDEPIFEPADPDLSFPLDSC